MATLAVDKQRRLSFEQRTASIELPIIADDIIFAGAYVGESSSAGTARPLQGGDVFLGIAEEQCDNAGGAAAAKRVKLIAEGILHRVAVTGLSGGNADLGAAVYAADDDTLNTTASANTQIGKVDSYNADDGTYNIHFQAAARRSI